MLDPFRPLYPNSKKQSRGQCTVIFCALPWIPPDQPTTTLCLCLHGPEETTIQATIVVQSSWGIAKYYSSQNKSLSSAAVVHSTQQSYRRPCVPHPLSSTGHAVDLVNGLRHCAIFPSTVVVSRPSFNCSRRPDRFSPSDGWSHQTGNRNGYNIPLATNQVVHSG